MILKIWIQVELRIINITLIKDIQDTEIEVTNTIIQEAIKVEIEDMIAIPAQSIVEIPEKLEEKLRKK